MTLLNCNKAASFYQISLETKRPLSSRLHTALNYAAGIYTLKMTQMISKTNESCLRKSVAYHLLKLLVEINLFRKCANRRNYFWLAWLFLKLTTYFRQIDTLAISLLKTLLSRNFCQKCVRLNFRNVHTVPQHF